MTRKTALRRMMGGQKVYHPKAPDAVYFYDESQEKEGQSPIRVKLEDGTVIGGVIVFFAQDNLGWKEYKD